MQGSKKWVMVIAGKGGGASAPALVTEDAKIIGIAHPRTTRVAPFLYHEDLGRIDEIQTMKALEDKHSSWLLKDEIQEDGTLYFCTPVDPLFLLLPVLSANSTRFQPLDQIVPGVESPNITLVLNCAKLSLSNICDVKDKYGPDMILYKLNTEKTLKWLEAKVSSVMESLTKDPCLLSSISSSSIVTKFNAGSSANLASSTGASSHKLKVLGFGFVKEYLSEQWEKKLSEFMKISSAPETTKVEKEEEASASLVPISKWEVQSSVREEAMEKLMFEANNPAESMRKQKELEASNPDVARKKRRIEANAKAAKGCRSMLSFFSKKS